MKATVSRSTSQFGFHTESVSNREHRQRSYQRVFDERKRPIRGFDDKWIMRLPTDNLRAQVQAAQTTL